VLVTYLGVGLFVWWGAAGDAATTSDNPVVTRVAAATARLFLSNADGSSPAEWCSAVGA
jgi:hypothetical protein